MTTIREMTESLNAALRDADSADVMRVVRHQSSAMDFIAASVFGRLPPKPEGEGVGRG